jgi:hypothetical protein
MWMLTTIQLEQSLGVKTGSDLALDQSSDPALESRIKVERFFFIFKLS